jgi:hypothetical protein
LHVSIAAKKLELELMGERLTKEKNGANLGASSLSAMIEDVSMCWVL